MLNPGHKPPSTFSIILRPTQPRADVGLRAALDKEAFAWILVCDLTLFAIGQLGIWEFTGLGIYLNYFGELLHSGY